MGDGSSSHFNTIQPVNGRISRPCQRPLSLGPGLGGSEMSGSEIRGRFRNAGPTEAVQTCTVQKCTVQELEVGSGILRPDVALI
eukprot:14185363-Alexandrium_andersonii.AAC.1